MSSGSTFFRNTSFFSCPSARPMSLFASKDPLIDSRILCRSDPKIPPSFAQSAPNSCNSLSLGLVFMIFKFTKVKLSLFNKKVNFGKKNTGLNPGLKFTRFQFDVTQGLLNRQSTCEILQLSFVSKSMHHIVSPSMRR